MRLRNRWFKGCWEH